MNIFDIIGPVMVGPSSSHTAGAVKIGCAARKLLGEPVKNAEIYLYGSFLATGSGHGTQFALVAGLLGMKPDDARIPKSFDYAKKAGMTFSFSQAKLRRAHPNSVQLKLTGVSGKKLDFVGESVGGSLINISSIGPLKVNFSGEKPTFIIRHKDKPGFISSVTGLLAENDFNIATMNLYRRSRGGEAVMIVECDQEIPDIIADELKNLFGAENITFYSLKDDFDEEGEK